MDLLQMRYFYEVARTEHVTNSAKALHIAQPALTRSIHRLETELGIPLFSRRGRNVRLTAQGRRLLELVTPILNGVDAIEKEMGLFQEGFDSTVTIQTDTVNDMLVGNIIDYRRLFPHAEFSLSRTGEADLADVAYTSHLATAEDAPDITFSETVMEFTEEIALIVPNEHPFGDAVDPRAIDGQPMVALTKNHAFRRICDQLCSMLDIAPSVELESDSLFMTNRLVQVGMGTAFWPLYSWKGIGHKNVRLVHIDSPRFSQVIRYELTDKATASKESRRFFRFNVEVARKFHDIKNTSDRFDLDSIPMASERAGRNWADEEIRALDEW